MDFQIPDKPIRPGLDPNDPQYAGKMLDYQQALSDYQLTVQITQQELTEQISANTDLDRGRHDAMMTIIRNL